MNEKFSGEKGPAPENLEDQKHRELQEAMGEEDRIMREIDNILASTPNRAEAEKIVLEKWAPLMDEAMKKSSESLKAWFNAMKESEKQILKEAEEDDREEKRKEKIDPSPSLRDKVGYIPEDEFSFKSPEEMGKKKEGKTEIDDAEKDSGKE